MWWLLAIGVVVFLVLIVVGWGTVASKPAIPAQDDVPPVAASGTVTVAYPPADRDGSPCDGSGDIMSGASVVVTDTHGATLGTGNLLTGMTDGPTCRLGILIRDLPGGKGTYRISVASRPPVDVAEADLDAIDLTY